MFFGIIIGIGVIAALASRLTGSNTVFYVGLFVIMLLILIRELRRGRVGK